MDIATIIGLVGAFAAMGLGIISGGAGFATYVDIPSFFIVIVGGICASVVGFPMSTVKDLPKLIGKTFKDSGSIPAKTISSIIELANKARKEGLLSLEEAARDMDDEFLKKGLGLVVDGTDPEIVRNLLETELDFIEQRHKNAQGFLEMIATMGPGFGMIGTLFGLVAMLKNLSDSASLGPNMAVALITTLYGSILANVFFTPMAKKLSLNSATEMLERGIILEGLLSIQAGENPRIIEEKLKAFLPPSMRVTENTGGKSGE